jgi:hypothetical protein
MDQMEFSLDQIVPGQDKVFPFVKAKLLDFILLSKVRNRTTLEESFLDHEAQFFITKNLGFGRTFALIIPSKNFIFLSKIRNLLKPEKLLSETSKTRDKKNSINSGKACFKYHTNHSWIFFGFPSNLPFCLVMQFEYF